MNIPNIFAIARYLFCLYTLFTLSVDIRCVHVVGGKTTAHELRASTVEPSVGREAVVGMIEPRTRESVWCETVTSGGVAARAERTLSHLQDDTGTSSS